MEREDLKDLLKQVGMGRLDAIEALTDLLLPLLTKKPARKAPAPAPVEPEADNG